MDRNPRYSVRAFALALGMSSSALSQILAGTRGISSRVIEKLLRGLELSESDRQRFIRSVLEEKTRNGTQKVNRALQRSVVEVSEPKSIGMDQFRIIADWYHLAILELTAKKDFRCDARWISRKLGISPTEATLAIQRLQSLELLEERDGTWKKSNLSIDTRDKTKTSASHRRRQQQILEKSAHSLENDPIEIRNHSGVTVCLDPDRIPVAKQMIQKFLWELTAYLEGGNSSQVYELHMQMFPLERKET